MPTQNPIYAPGPNTISTVAFDADDTLWQNEKYFRLSEDGLASLLSEYSTIKDVRSTLVDTERRNLRFYGYGIKGFTLSMIETAIEITQGRAPIQLIQQIIDLGRDMLSHPIELLPGAEQAIRELLQEFTVILITKGDLLDQERKVAQSGLGPLFHGVEIVSEKSPAEYSRIFNEYGHGARHAMMIGNSVASDILPALKAGSWAVLVPSELDWELESGPPPRHHQRFREIKSLRTLPSLVREINRMPVK